MNHKTITYLLAVAMTLSASPVLAIEGSAAADLDQNFSGQSAPAQVNIRTEVKAQLEKRFEERKASTTARIQEFKASTTARFQELRASTTERLKELKANVETRKAEIKAQEEARKASSTARRVEMQQGLAKKKADQTSRLITTTIERLEKIIVRLESRITKLKSEGKTTVESEAFVAQAKTHLSAAKADAALFASLDLSGEKAKENFDRIRTLAMDAKEEIRGAQQSLMEALKALPGAHIETGHSSTTTNETGDHQSGTNE